MTARLTMNGVDLSGPASLLGPNFRGAHGQGWYDETNRNRYVWDDDLGFLVPENKGIVSGSAPRYIADDFKGGTLDSAWQVTKGNDDVAANFAISGASPLGLLVGTTGDAGTGIAADGIAIAGPLSFTPGTTNDLVLQAKVKWDVITNLRFFLGFTDVLPGTTFEQPASLSVVTYTTTATDAVGFLFDTAATSDTIRCVGVANDVDATHVATALAPVADTYKVFKIVVRSGTAYFYIDGTLVGTVAAAVTTSVALCPILLTVPITAASKVVTADYIFVK